MHKHPAFALLALSMAGCAIHADHAARPADWQDAPTQQLSVSGRGDWARLRNQPLSVGDFRTRDLDYSLWDTAPTRTRTTIGDENDGLSGGFTRLANESGFSFGLDAPAGPLAHIRCQQSLALKNSHLAYADDHRNVFALEVNEEHRAALSCAAQPLSSAWPQWRMDLRATNLRPYFGILRTGDRSFAVISTQDGSVARLAETTGIYIKDGNRTVMLVDLLNSGAVHVHPELQAETTPAVTAAAIALLLANDPLAAE